MRLGHRNRQPNRHHQDGGHGHDQPLPRLHRQSPIQAATTQIEADGSDDSDGVERSQRLQSAGRFQHDHRQDHGRNQRHPRHALPVQQFEVRGQFPVLGQAVEQSHGGHDRRVDRRKQEKSDHHPHHPAIRRRNIKIRHRPQKAFRLGKGAQRHASDHHAEYRRNHHHLGHDQKDRPPRFAVDAGRTGRTVPVRSHRPGHVGNRLHPGEGENHTRKNFPPFPHTLGRRLGHIQPAGKDARRRQPQQHQHRRQGQIDRQTPRQSRTESVDHPETKNRQDRPAGGLLFQAEIIVGLVAADRGRHDVAGQKE